MNASLATLAAARALLDRAVRDRANAYGGSGAVGVGWEAYLLPRVPALVGRRLPDGALLHAAVSFGAELPLALECSARGLRQPDFLFLIEHEDRVGIAGADAKLGLDTVDAAQIAAETTARILIEGGPLAQAAIAVLGVPDAPAVDGYILTPQRTLNDLVLGGTRPLGMPAPKLPERTHIITVAASGAALLAAVPTGPFARDLVEGTDEAFDVDAAVDPAILCALAAHLLLGMWREGETPLIVPRVGAEPPTADEYDPAVRWGRERVRRAGNAWDAAIAAQKRARPRLDARARVQEAMQPPLADPAVLAALGDARGRASRVARAAAATAYRTALLDRLPPDLTDRGDVLLDAIQIARRRDADALRTATIAAIRRARANG